ncbi:MAG TPA: DedA family protein [Noviherbaspirillum sp.]|jgi:membrane protein DedA with SNARE-associated domain|uniref:DedA family protein n=1 Tax=Noviherbaspirillum sp. TaxID=1926288 RepID=UPI002F945EEA
MEISQLIHEYGYLAVAIGSFFEGEAVLLAGSVAAYHGHLALPLVLLLGALFSFLGDQPYFFAGRHYGPAVLSRYPSIATRKGRIDEMLEKHHVLLVLSLRFLYGLRIAGLLALGMSRMSPLRFLVLDFIGALIWATAVTAAGLGLGKLLEEVLAVLDRDAGRMSLLLALLAASSLLIIFSRRRRAVPQRVRND